MVWAPFFQQLAFSDFQDNRGQNILAFLSQNSKHRTFGSDKMSCNLVKFDGRAKSFDMGTLLSQTLHICPISPVVGQTDPQIQRAKGPRPITKAKAKVAWFGAVQRSLKRLVVFIIIVSNGKYAKYFVLNCSSFHFLYG